MQRLILPPLFRIATTDFLKSFSTTDMVIRYSQQHIVLYLNTYFILAIFKQWRLEQWSLFIALKMMHLDRVNLRVHCIT